MNTRDALTALDILSTPTQSALIDARQRGEEAKHLDMAEHNRQWTRNPYKYDSETPLWLAWAKGYLGEEAYTQLATPPNICIMDDEDAHSADIQALKRRLLESDRKRVESDLRKNTLLSLCHSLLDAIPRERFGPEMRATLDSVQDQVGMELKGGGE